MIADLIFFGKILGIIAVVLLVVIVLACMVSSGAYSRRKEQQELRDELAAWHAGTRLEEREES